MKGAKETSIGKRIYLYFEKDELKKYIKKSHQPKHGGIIIPAYILEASSKKKRKPKIIAVASKKYFRNDKEYGEHSIKLDAADTKIITDSELFDIQVGGGDTIRQICEINGYDPKAFTAAFSKFAGYEVELKSKKDK